MLNQQSSFLTSRRIPGLVSAAALALTVISPTTGFAVQAMPASIRVGTGCACKSCPSVVTVSMETYVKRVLPSEWISGWNAESLKAGALAIRSYGAYHVYHPVSSTFDICDSTCCQKYTTTQYATTDAAVDATKNVYIVDTAGNIARAEYSAENNDGANRDGCGNAYILNNPSDGVCLSDSLCAGFTQNGHGRGMCQWGTQRWALNGKTAAWISDHYFDAYGWARMDLTPPTGVTIIVDNAAAGFAASANWITATSATDRYGTNYRYRSTAAVSDSATFTANITSAGTYTVSAWWCQGANRSATAPYVLPNNTTVPRNQQAGGGVWNSLGSVNLSTGAAVTKLSCWTTTGFIVVADAIKYVK